MILNSEQSLAVLNESKYIFLLAGAGSGKTRVIIERIRHLIKKNIAPAKILCITFTTKAMHEMKERLENIDADVYTFHGYCYEKLSQMKTFKIFEDETVFDADDLLSISNYKNSLMKSSKPRMFKKYQAYLKSNNYLDFDDLLLESLPLVSKHSYEYIFVDEFQDTNALQFEILKQLLIKQPSCFAVGDPDQSIYAFRGAQSRIINKYITDYHAKLLFLNQNYRSTQPILDVANKFIKLNLNRMKKTLYSQTKDGENPMLFIGRKNLIENQIIKFIKTLRLQDVAVIYRNHYQGYRIKKILQRHYLFHIKTMTFHETKGLEFENVFIIGLEIFPFDKEKTYSNLEEERRLLFVAITRAKKRLYLFSIDQTKHLAKLGLKAIYLKSQNESSI